MDVAQSEGEYVHDLTTWRETGERLLALNQPAEAISLLYVILQHLPRYLPAYVQMLQALWLLRRWDEGRMWALRLLRADPTQELAWATLANAAEDAGKPVQARRYWLFAFEQAPYNRPIRGGVVRTALGQALPLTLTRPALATLYRLGRRWQRAADLYRALVAEQPARLDWSCGLLEALWHIRRTDEALALARVLVKQEPNLLVGWLVSTQMGDEDDRALAQAPLAALDVDGAYTLARYGVQSIHTGSPLLSVTDEEAALLKRMMQAAAAN